MSMQETSKADTDRIELEKAMEASLASSKTDLNSEKDADASSVFSFSGGVDKGRRSE